MVLFVLIYDLDIQGHDLWEITFLTQDSLGQGLSINQKVFWAV